MGAFFVIADQFLCKGTVFFKLVVSTAFNQWATQKRYSQFEEFHNNVLVEMNGKGSVFGVFLIVVTPVLLCAVCARAALPAGAELPPKKIKLFTSHSSPEFIEVGFAWPPASIHSCRVCAAAGCRSLVVVQERRVLLESYLKVAFSRPLCLTRQHASADLTLARLIRRKS